MKQSKSLITLNEPNSMVSESYKMFRTNLNYMNVDVKQQVILFTSSTSEEGKTTTVCNTAVEYAKYGYKTLLIECDLRKARVHHIFNIAQSPGLTNVIAENQEVHMLVNRIAADDLHHLDVLTAGPLPPSAAEMVASKKMERLIDELRTEYDIILIDAPPVLTVADAAILSRFVDGVIIIAATQQTKKQALVQAKKHLEKVEANILGVVLTKVDIKRSGYYYGYKSYYGHEHKKGMKKLFSKKKKVDYLDGSKKHNVKPITNINDVKGHNESKEVRKSSEARI